VTTTAVDPLHLENQVCFGLVTAARSVVAFYKPFLEPLGLTHPQYLVMLALWEHGALSVRRISDLLMLEPATVSPLIKRLEAQGLLTRRRDRNDERHLQVSLTEAGQQMREQALKIPSAIAQTLRMTPEEFADMRATLDRLLAAMARA
jgi:MarR family transcriptional regulator, organic hydroperoxide resistance regulator